MGGLFFHWFELNFLCHMSLMSARENGIRQRLNHKTAPGGVDWVNEGVENCGNN